MNIELQQLGSTIIIGIFVLFSLVVFITQFSKTTPYIRLENQFKKSKNMDAFPQFIIFAIIVLIALSLGIIAENLSDDFTDKFPLSNFVGEEKGMRTKLLFDKDGSLTSFGVQLHRANVLNTFGYDKHNDLDKIANDIYYFAKNTVYKHETYFNELRDIQIRISFTRSFALISLFLVLLFIFSLFRILIIQKIERVNKSGNKSVNQIISEGFSLIAFLILAGASLSSYAKEEKQFNLRVYGYFYTLISSNDEEFQSIISKMVPPPISGLTTLKSDKEENSEKKENRYAVVDKKISYGHRVFRVGLDRGEIYYEPLPVQWNDKYRVPADLEGICSDESSLWVVEGSKWRNNNPRLLELKQTEDYTWELAKSIELPSELTDIEGLECKRDDSNNLWFLLGQRGNKQEMTELHRYKLEKKGKDDFELIQKKPSYPITSPLQSPLEGVRHISDLAIINKTLVISSARDNGDYGPFESVVFSVGCINDDMSLQGKIEPINWLDEQVDEIKVEGITDGWKPDTLLVGADNENLEDTLDIMSIGNRGPKCPI